MKAFRLKLFDVNAGLLLGDETLLDPLQKALFPGVIDSTVDNFDYYYKIHVSNGRTGSGKIFKLYYQSVPLLECHGIDVLLNSLLSHFYIKLAGLAGHLSFIHAGVVSIDNQAVLLPGKSFSGKSTLVKALVDRGAAYYSDDLGVIDSDGQAVAFPKALSLRTSRHDHHSISAGRLGWKESFVPRPVSLIIFSRYVCGHTFCPELISRGSASIHLFRYFLSAAFHPEYSMRKSIDLCTKAINMKGIRGDAYEAAEVILGLLK